jgi:DNA-binding MarR family transcriptional regulator
MQMQRLHSQENVGLLIAAARRRIKQAVGELGRPYHLSAQRFWLLLGIEEREGLSLCELAGAHRIDEPTASRIVRALARQGLVRIAEDPEDGRRSQLFLTGPGGDLARRLRPLAEGLREATVEGFSQEEKRMLAASLRRVVENVDRFVSSQRRVLPRASAGGGA